MKLSERVVEGRFNKRVNDQQQGDFLSRKSTDVYFESIEKVRRNIALWLSQCRESI